MQPTFTRMIVAGLSLCCWGVYADGTNALLTFHIISDQRINGGRFVDTPAFPKLGYIASSPDLVITKLRDVFPLKQADNSIMGDTNGTQRVVPSHPLPALSVLFQPEDAKRFEALTERALDKQLLVMFSGKPLNAPWVRAPIGSGSFSLRFPNEAELKKTENGLRKLIQ